MSIYTQLSIDGKAEWRGVYRYPSHGKRYWRLQWGEGAKNLGQMHIPGGAVGSSIADARATELNRWIQQGRSLKDCQKLVCSWKGKPKPKR